MLYDKSEYILKGLYKAASFVVQAIYFKQTGHYIRQQSELLKIVLCVNCKNFCPPNASSKENTKNPYP